MHRRAGSRQGRSWQRGSHAGTTVPLSYIPYFPGSDPTLAVAISFGT
jgi:hypothetical protein